MPIARINGFFSQRPWLVSLILVTVLTVWLGLGMLRAEENPTAEKKEEPVPLAKVVVSSFSAEPTAKSVNLYGRTAPNREATLGAEIAGKIIALKVSKGDAVKKGQAIAQIDKGDLDIRLEKARAILSVKEKEFKAANSLKKRGLQGEVAYSTAQAALTEARAGVRNAQLALSNTEVKAPFTGVIEDMMIEVGDFVGIGDPVAKVLDLSTLVIEADVSERHVDQLKLNKKAHVRLVTGQEVEGHLRYISRVSSPATNTFAIEVEIPNQGQKTSAGVSAEVDLQLATQLAIKVTPAMLALDEAGNLGVKTVQAEDKVKFVPIQLVKAEQDGVWLTGLGKQVEIITVGQGFVRDGDSVVAIRQ
ncbi:Multidrug efflux transporter VexE [Vibrio nigripulchritudo MADA3029]|uniref:efflux RND transporter periplasmic adaptor subunit n=1 Tax=Vibrio nigripulchritudo TaxID=28173 RepID=UPI0003B23A89|nr:efflux RND transporter periplasmic adaptor subunit [Vibrio nigripulchritudo]CCN45213.1 Multidrug efflux transporter VexE [Vibrio nigripulchritudo MADA3020]CCN53972.1 Multidrug efflux transporter VexE [Vibrio nigripulchritudo MADA3021]CCN57601.1 Multidrug efflux transporter VexE [Vibrio nigripulchritudo MADA3029]